MGILVDFENCGCVAAAPEEVEAGESSGDRRVAFEFDNVLAHKRYLHCCQDNRHVLFESLSARLPSVHARYMLTEVFWPSARVVALGASDALFVMHESVHVKDFSQATRETADVASMCHALVELFVRIQYADSLEFISAHIADVRTVGVAVH